jgi:hypothetical protein
MLTVQGRASNDFLLYYEGDVREVPLEVMDLRIARYG